MPKCGNCKEEGQTVEHVRQCYSTVKTMERPVAREASDFQPMAMVTPDSKYAITGADGVLRFYNLRTGKKGQWKGVRFLDLLVGHPGDWASFPVKGLNRKFVMDEIAKNPKAAALRYAEEFTRCAVCDSPLSDPESIAAGIGPVCATRF